MTTTTIAWLCAGVLTLPAKAHLGSCEGWLLDEHGAFQTRFWNPKPARAHARRVKCIKAGAITLGDCERILKSNKAH